jgi:uncharacterized protein YhaN
VKLEKLYITGFGALRELEFPEIGPGLNIIEGANEAGKTTLLEFVRALFFGFAPRDKSNDDARRYEPAQGGAHGGWAILQNRHGEKWRIERTGGRHSAGNCTVEMPDGQSAQSLEAILGYTDRALYEQVFAFSLDELNDLSRSAEQMEKRVYAAASGSLGYSLLDALEKSRKHYGDIYLKKGSKQPLNATLAQYRKLQEEVKQLSGQIEIYNNDRAALLAQEQQTKNLTEQVAQAEQTLQTAQIHAKSWESWVRLSALRAGLNALPEQAQFFAEAPRQMEDWRAVRKQCDEKLQEIQQRLESNRKNLEENIPDNPLLENALRITQLKDQLAVYESAARQLPVLQTRLESSRKSITAQLDQLGLKGDEIVLSRIDVSLAARQYIQQFKDHLENSRAALEAAIQKEAATAAQAEHLQKNIQQLCEKIEHDFPQQPPAAEQLEERQKALRQADALLRQTAEAQTRGDFARERLDALQQRNEEEPLKVLLSSWWSLAFAAAALGALLLLRATPPAAILCALLFLLCAGAIVWISRAQQANLKTAKEASERRARQLSEEMNRLREEAEHHTASADKARDDLQKIGQHFGWTLTSRDDWENVADLLQQNRDAHLRYENALDNINLRENDLKQLLELQQIQKEETAARKSTFNDVEKQWNDWLQQQHHLPVGLQPQNALAFLDHAGNARRDIAARDELRQELESLEKQRAQFVENAHLLWEKLQREIPPETDLPAGVRGLWEALDEQKKLQIKREGLLKERQDLQDDETVQSNRLNDAETEIARLLERTDSCDENDFAQKSRDAHQRNDLREKCEAELRILDTHSAPGAARFELEKSLAQLDAMQVQNNLAAARENYSSLHEKLLEAKENLGALNNKVRQLEENETHLTSLLRQLEEQKTAIADLTGEWAVARLTNTLLEYTRARFEKERQPAVIKRAGELMSDVTAGRYQAVIALNGLDKVELDSGERGRKSLSRWSRGTREQFYLALRLAFIENYCSAEHLEPLPVIMDDVLVHADGYHRLAAAGAMIAAFAEKYQVLYFTCRPGDAEVLCAAAPAARRFRLEAGKVV